MTYLLLTIFAPRILGGQRCRPVLEWTVYNQMTPLDALVDTYDDH